MCKMRVLSKEMKTSALVFPLYGGRVLSSQALQFSLLCLLHDRKWHLCCALCFSEAHVEDEEGLYDCVYGEDDGGEVYEDLMKAEEAPQSVGLWLH